MNTTKVATKTKQILHKKPEEELAKIRLSKIVVETRNWLEKSTQDRIQTILRHVSDNKLIGEVADLSRIIAVLQKSHLLAGRVLEALDEITKNLVEKWHDDMKNKVQKELDIDQWIREEKGANTVALPSHYVQAVKVLAGELSIEEYSSFGKVENKIEESSKLVICGEDFSSVANSCLSLLHVLLKIVQNVRTLPKTSIHTGANHAARAALAILNHYNKRSCNLIVGAEACQSAAKLKNITARHMAVCRRSLELVVIALPSLLALLSPDLLIGCVNVVDNFENRSKKLKKKLKLTQLKSANNSLHFSSFLQPFRI